jgi:hypothetical protein
LPELQKWEALKFGMFIYYGISTCTGSELPDGSHPPCATREYLDFQSPQIEELLAQYGMIGGVWIDIPAVLPRVYRHELYNRMAPLQPEALIMMNNGISDGSQYPIAKAWPADLFAIERFLPNSHISRGTNLLLDVGPDKHGLIPEKYQGALKRLRKNLDRLGM